MSLRSTMARFAPRSAHTGAIRPVAGSRTLIRDGGCRNGQEAAIATVLVRAYVQPAVS